MNVKRPILLSLGKMKQSNDSSQNGCEKRLKSEYDLEVIDFQNLDEMFQGFKVISFNKLIMDLECESTFSVSDETPCALQMM